MWNIVSLRLQSFGCFENVTHKFIQGIPVIVRGENRQDVGQLSNGVGKSFLLDGIAFALAGSAIRKCNNNELIRNKSETAYVEIKLVSKDGQEIEVQRKLLAKSATCNAFYNGEPIHAASIKEKNVAILDIIGVTREDLFSYYLISRGKHQSFFSSSPVAKEQLIMRISKSGVLEAIIEKGKQELSAKEVEVGRSKMEVSNLQATVATLRESYLEIKNRTDSKVDETKKTEEAITKTKGELRSFGEEVQVLESQMPQAQAEVTLQRTAYEEAKKATEEKEREEVQFNERIQELQGKIEKVSADQSKQRQELNGVNALIQSLIKCPECDAEFLLKSPLTKEELQKKKASIEELIATLAKEKEGAELQMGEVRKEKQAINVQEFRAAEKQAKDRVSSASEILATKEQSIQSKKRQVELAKEQVSRLEESLEEFRRALASPENKVMDELVAKGKTKATELEEAKVRLAEQEKQYGHISAVREDFKRFKTHITNRVLTGLQIAINERLTRISDMQVDLSSLAELTSGKTSDNIQPQVVRNGRKQTFETLSAGEKARADLCCISAIQLIIRGGGVASLDFTFIDEILGEVDEEGMAEIVKSMQQFMPNTYIVTHSGAENKYPKVITLRKEDGRSTIVE